MSEKRNIEEVESEICKILDRIGAIKFGAFTLTSGKASPYYIDLRIIPSFPDAFRKICNLYATFIRYEVGVESFDRIAGIPIAGVPLASLVAYKLKKPFFYLRKGVRLHGRQRRVEGILTPGDQVLLIDDLITTGLSLRNAAKAVHAEGGLAKEAVVLLDREEGGRENLHREGIRLYSLLTISRIVDKLYEMGTIDKEQMKTILRQIKK